MLLVGFYIWRNYHSSTLEQTKLVAKRRGDYSDDQIDEMSATQKFPVPNAVAVTLMVATIVPVAWGLFNDIFFYAEPGYKYHVRTITGTEKVVDDVGYNMHLFGRIEPWKKALSVVASKDGAIVGESSSNLGESRVTFLDQVDALVSATARFRLSSDPELFLSMAREYRTQSNLLNTTLIPAFKETIRANAALMGAEDYFSGAQTQFNIDFENQLNEGLFIVRRKEVVVPSMRSSKATANASKGTEQDEFGEDDKVVFEVQKVMDLQGVARRKVQSFAALGVTVVEARVTNVVPNNSFLDRMGLKQQASADRAIAREQRVQEEEQRLLAETRGEREVAEKKAASLVKQIEVTTDAETEKQLTITNAEREKEKAQIEREQAEILLEKAKIDAEARTVAADAEAYEKRVVIEADNALAQKLSTLETINRAWADAYAKRAVPTTVFGSSGENGMTSDGGAQQFMDILTMKAAKDLSFDFNIKKGTTPTE
jgi:regulator of protease activity HflC (stomatin/prohibitin superfamily)